MPGLQEVSENMRFCPTESCHLGAAGHPAKNRAIPPPDSVPPKTTRPPQISSNPKRDSAGRDEFKIHSPTQFWNSNMTGLILQAIKKFTLRS